MKGAPRSASPAGSPNHFAPPPSNTRGATVSPEPTVLFVSFGVTWAFRPGATTTRTGLAQEHTVLPSASMDRTASLRSRQSGYGRGTRRYPILDPLMLRCHRQAASWHSRRVQSWSNGCSARWSGRGLAQCAPTSLPHHPPSWLARGFKERGQGSPESDRDGGTLVRLSGSTEDESHSKKAVP